MIPSDVCSSAVRGSWSFYGNQVGAFMFQNKRKTDQKDQMGCQVGQHPRLSFGIIQIKV